MRTNHNVLGHSGLAQAQAFAGGFDPSSGIDNIDATSDSSDTPTALNTILDTTLALNGGETPTHALPEGSPALDSAAEIDCNNVGKIDQRNIPRGFNADGNSGSPQTGDCDIGAFEFFINEIFDDSFESS